MKQRKQNLKKAQTILELFAVLTLVSFFFAAAFVFNNIFEIGQKQTMLVRTQAMLELGNYSDFGTAHGEDSLDNNQSAIVFELGKPSQGTRIKLDAVTAFKKAVEGEMKFDGALPATDEKYWKQYGFPKGTVKYKWDIDKDDVGSTKEFTMTQTAVISANRSLNLNENPSDLSQAASSAFGGGTGMYSGGTHLMKWFPVSKAEFAVGTGLIDNSSFVDEQLKEIITDDPSLALEAQKFRNRVNAMDGLTGGGIAAIITGLLSVGFNFGLPALEGLAAGGSAGTAAGATAGAASSATSSINSVIQTLGGGGGLIEGATIYNAGQILGTVSNGLNLVNAGLALGGEQVEGLQIAAGVTGAAAGIAGGISSFQKFNGAQFVGGDLGQAGLNSDIFKGVSQISGGAGTIGGYADPKFGQVAGIVSAVSGFGAVTTGFAENLSGENLSSGWYNKGADGKLEVGNWVSGGGWAAVAAGGAVLSSAGGIVGIADPNSKVAMGLGLAGAGLSVTGGIGGFVTGVQDGKINFSDKPFEAMVQASAVVGGASALGGSLAQATGNKDLAEKFGYATLGAGAVGLVGAAGMLANAMGEYAKDSSKKEEGQVAQGSEKSSESKAEVPDTRSDFQKFNDAKGAIDGAIGAASGVIGTASAVKGTIDTYNAAMDAAEAQEAAVYAQQRAVQDQIAADLQAANGEAAGSSSFSSGFSIVGKASGKPATSLEQLTAKQVMNQVTGLNAKKGDIRAQLSDDQKATFDEYFDAIAAGENEIQKASAESRQPDQQIVRDMLTAYQGAKRIVDMQEAYDRQTIASSDTPRLSIDSTNSGSRLSLMPTLRKSHREFTHLVANQIRMQGVDKFAQGSLHAMNDLQSPARLSEFKNLTNALSRKKIQSKFGVRDGRSILNALDRAEEAVAAIDRAASSGQIPPAVYLEVAQKEIQSAQRLVNKKVKVQNEENQYRADLELVKKSHEEYQKKIRDAKEVQVFVEAAEKHLSYRPVMASNSKEKRDFQKFSNQAAEKIENYRDHYKTEGTEADRRLDRAQEFYERVQFTTGRETFKALQAHLEDRSRRYVELKTKIHRMLARRKLATGQDQKAVN